MATISEQLRFRATVKGDSDITAGRKEPKYGKRTEIEWHAADVIDTLVAALIQARGCDVDPKTANQIDAALEFARKEPS